MVDSNTQINGGVFNTTQHITLNASDDYSNIIIYYTTDGSNPLNSTTRKIYSKVIDIELDCVLNCVAIDSAGNIGNITSFIFNITDVFKINTTLIDEIQKILDMAEPYSKLFFDYDLIEGANFTIKKPLNIITTTQTKFFGNGIQPVLSFRENATGTIINGFTLKNNNTEAILLKDNNDITICNCIVSSMDSVGINIINSTNIIINSTVVDNSTDGIIVNKSINTDLDNVLVNNSYNNGVWIINSQKTMITNSLLESNGRDWYTSKANQVLIDDSKDTLLYNNIIKYGYFGVHLYHTTDNTTIFNNTIYESVGDAILLSNTYSNVNITYNIIDGCYNGVDFMGYSENVSIVRNVIENLHEHDGDLYSFHSGNILYIFADYVYEIHFPADMFFNHCYNGIQVSYPASNFHEGDTLIIDNVIIKLQHRAWESRKYQHYIEGGCAGYGYNLFDGSASYTGEGGATRYSEGKVDLVVDRIGDATFLLRLINRLDGHYLSNIPEFDVTFRAGGFLQTVKFINDSAIATFDVASVVSDIEAIISTEIRKSASFTMDITEGYAGSTKTYDPGFERGEAYDNPDPVIPSMDELIKKYTGASPSVPVVNPPTEEEHTGYGNGTGDGQGTGTGSGTGIGDGGGASGNFGNGTSNILTDIISDTLGMIGDAINNITNEIASENVVSNVEDSTELGEATTTEANDNSEGMERSTSGGSDAGNGEVPMAYEVSKKIPTNENTTLLSTIIAALALLFFIYGFLKRKL